MEKLRIVDLKNSQEIKEKAADWFYSKWGVPKESHLECMENYLIMLLMHVKQMALNHYIWLPVTRVFMKNTAGSFCVWFMVMVNLKCHGCIFTDKNRRY